MPSAWKTALGAILAGAAGGAKGYGEQRNKMREYAIKELEARPGIQKGTEYVMSLPKNSEEKALAQAALTQTQFIPGSDEQVRIGTKEKPGQLTEGEVLRNALNKKSKRLPLTAAEQYLVNLAESKEKSARARQAQEEAQKELYESLVVNPKAKTQ